MITMESVVIAIVFILIQLFAISIVQRSPIGEHKLLSLCGGVAIAYVFVYILPTLHEEQEELGGSLALDTELYALGLFALLVYFAVHSYAHKHAEIKSRLKTVFMVQVSFFTLYSFIITYVVFSSDVETFEALFYGLAVSLHFIGVSYYLGREHADLHKRVGRFMFAGGTLLGAIAGSFGPSTGLFVDSLIAFSSGAMIFIVISKEIPLEKNAHLPTFILASLLYAMATVTLKAFFNW